MAKNEVFKQGEQIYITVPAGTASGDPVVDGQIPGVALSAIDAANKASVSVRGVYSLSVKAIDGGGNSAVAEGDVIYYVSADTPKLSKKNTGVRFGYALDAITSGSTATIRVLLGY